MNIRIVPTNMQGIIVIEPDTFKDHRGFFFESYSKRTFADHGLDHVFVQDNHSRSTRGVVRGLHYQDGKAPQYRLVRCTVGTVWDVVVDLRVGSPTFGKWLGITLSAENKKQVLMAPEFAHGFAVLSDVAEIQYKCTNYHYASAEASIAWDDPDLRIAWPVKDPIMSERDKMQGTRLREYLQHPAFKYMPADVVAEQPRHVQGSGAATAMS